jgi:hypothetical protein
MKRCASPVLISHLSRWVTWTDRDRDTVVLSVLPEEWLQIRDAGRGLETFD